MASKAGTAYIPVEADLSPLQKTVRGAVRPMAAQFRQVGSGALASSAGLKKASAATSELDTRTRRLQGSLRTAGKYAISAAAAYVGLSEIKNAITATETLAKTTIGLSKNLGFSVSAASELGAVLQVRGADTKKANMAFATFAGQIRDASSGSEAAAANFTKLGISQKELQNSSPMDTLMAVADGLDHVGAGVDRVDIAKSLFGRGWQDLTPIMRDGSDALKEQMALANKYGASFTGDTLKGPEDLIKTQRELQLAQLGLQVSFTKNLAPALIATMQLFGQFIDAVKRASPTLRVIGVAVALVALAFVSIPAAIAGAVVAISLLYQRSEAFRNVVNTLGSAIKTGAVAAFNALKTAGQNTVQWVTQAAQNVAGFVTALYPVKIVLAVVAAVFQQVLAAVRPFIPVLMVAARIFGVVIAGAAKIAWEAIKLFGATVGNVVGVISNLLRGDFSGAWKNVKDIVTSTVRAIVNVLKIQFGMVKGLVRTVADALGGAFTGAWAKIKGTFSDGVKAVQGFINLIIDAINMIPGVSIGHVGGGGGKLPTSASQPSSKGNHQGLAVGGKVTAPTAIVGEEAPRHPEYVLATNPSYRKRNVGLWAEAGSMLGVPGFALGGRMGRGSMRSYLSAGVPGFGLGGAPGGPGGTGLGKLNPADIIGKLPGISTLPDWLRGMGSYMIRHTTNWIKDKITGLPGNVASGAKSLAGDAVSLVPGLARGGVIQAIRKKGEQYLSTAYGPPWDAMNGTGITSSGVNLTNAPKKYIVATDPGVIPTGSKVSMWPNPFGYLGTFGAEDVGGAIDGKHVDIYDWRGRGKQGAWGRRNISLMRGAAGPGVPPVKTGKGKATKKAKGLGLSASLQEQINRRTGTSDIHAEYAERANSLGQPVFGATELYWLQQELAELLALRSLLIAAVEQLKAALANLGVMPKGAKVKGARATKSAVGGIGPHGENDGYSASGLVNWPGVSSGKMAAWVAGALSWAKTQHGFKGTPTSGYRSHAQNVAAGRNYFSEHEGTAYPHGAVDFGSPTSGLAIRNAVVAATRDYKWPLKALIGDDGHASGTGHFMGGILGRAAGHLVKGLPGFKTGAGKKATSKAGKKAAEKMKAQREAITSKLSEVTSTLTDLQGVGSSMDNTIADFPVGSLGGRILDVQKSIIDYGGDGKGVDAPKGFSVDDLKSLMALKGMGVSFNPNQFAGVFHQGGIHPGPYGQERHAIVKGGEGTFTREQMAALAPVGAGGPMYADIYIGGEKIDERVEVKIRDAERGTALAARAGILR